MHHILYSRHRLAAVVAVAIGCLASAGAAQATVTTSNITVPADGSLFFDNGVASPNGTFTVSGTSDGASSDTVDLDCYNGGVVGRSYKGSGGKGVSVQTGGSFTATVPLSAFDGVSCDLLAVPHGGTPPSPPTGFTGPRVGFSDYFTQSLSGGQVFNAEFDEGSLTAASGTDSIGSCGPYESLVDGSSAMNSGKYLLDCAGSLYGSKADFIATSGFDLARSDIYIDGENAYGSQSAETLAASNPGLPALSASLDAFNPTTGDGQMTESEALVKCSPNDVFDPAPATDCTSFAATGVRIQRVTDFTNGGRVVTVTDTYTSADGASHRLDLEYETDLGNTAAGWELPGQTSFTNHSTGDTGGGASSAPGTILAMWNPAVAPSVSNPVAAMTFASAYNSVAFDNTLWNGEDSGLIDYQRTVPAGGSVVIQWSYATGTSVAEVQADAAAADDLFSPPTIAITSPGSGAGVTSTPVMVSGTVTAATGVKSVAVNGVAAAVSAGKFAAPIPLTLGSNTIKATVTTNSGATKSTSETVTYGVAPVVSTGGASRVGSSTAKVSGTVTPGSSSATYYFQYGKTAAYGHQSAAATLAGTASVSATLRGLASHSTYHYRLVATNKAGTSYGADRTFKTLYALRGMTVKVSRTGAQRYHVSGALKLPKGVSKAKGCNGSVTVTARHGSRKAGSHRAKVTKRCTYSATVSTHGHGKVSIVAAFSGNATIGPFTARG